MDRIRRTLRNQRGSLLIESMVASAITSIIVVSTVAVFMTMANAANISASNSARSIYLRSTVNEAALRVDALPAAPDPATGVPETTPETIGGHDVTVASWRQDIDTHASAVYVAAPRHGKAAACGPAQTWDAAHTRYDSTTDCLVEAVLVGRDIGGVSAVAVPAVTAATGTDLDATIELEADTTEVRYVFEVTGNTAGVSVTFADADDPTHDYALDIPAGTNGFVYGGLDVAGVTSMTVTSTGTADFHPETFLVYEAPTKGTGDADV